jgi:hypothetical protein
MTEATRLIDSRYSRNPRLNWALFQWGYVETPGNGIWSMIAV